MKLVIFDMDGLMFDTGRLAYRAYVETAKKFDLEISPDVYYHLTGRNELGIREGMKELYGDGLPTDVWRDYINQIKQEILNKEKRVYKKEGLLELLEFLKENEMLIGLASSSKKETILMYLEFEDMPDVFDVIVAGDEVRNGKPDPEIFLKACQKLNIKPESALVLEDSLAGIEAANKAGIPVILIEDDITDLPKISGGNKLRIKLPVSKKIINGNVKKMNNLSEVKEYLKIKLENIY